MVLQALSDAFDRLFRGPGALRNTAYFASGALAALGFAPAGLYLLPPLLLLPLLLSCLTDAPRTAARHGFFFGVGLFLAGTYWIYISVHVFGQAPLWLAVILMIALVLLMAAYYALAAAVIARWSAASPWRLIVIAPAVWVLMEWLRGWLFSGFPWLSLGYGHIDSFLAGWAPLGGIYAVTLLLMLSTAALPAAWMLKGIRQRVAISVVALPWIVGALLLQIDWTSASGEPLMTSIVQGGIGQDKKWLPEQFRPTLDLYRQATQAQRESKLIVWPEVALPTLADRVEPYLSMVEMGLRDRDASLVLGILERDHNSEHIFNSALLLNGGEIQRYRKRHLVPFGEYFPVPDSVREWMRLLSLPASDMTPGDDVQPLLKTADGHHLAVAICYEDAFGAEQLYALPEADILINLSNDAWFGDSLAPHQHLEMARMRALEVGRYSVRATNTGVSAFIGPKGELLAIAPQFQFAVLNASIVPMQGLTPYAKTGNWPTLIIVILMMFAGYRRRA